MKKFEEIFKKLNYSLTIEKNSVVIYKIGRGGKRKLTTNSTFPSLGAMDNFLNWKIEKVMGRIKEKEERKKREDKEMENVIVGDIFVSSWGYDQTNVDFYQVVQKPSRAFVLVREIKAKVVKSGNGGWVETVVPDSDNFIVDKEAFRRKLAGNAIKIYQDHTAIKMEKDGSKKFTRSFYA